MVIIGEGLTLESRNRIHNPRTGWTTVETWLGSCQECDAKIAQISLQGNHVDAQKLDIPGTGQARVVIVFADESQEDANELSYYWEIPNNRYNPPLLQHPKALALPIADVRAIRFNQALDKKGDNTTARIIPGSADGIAIDIRMSRGQTSYFKTAHILRLVQSISTRATLQISDVGVDQLYLVDAAAERGARSTDLEAEATAANAPIPDRMLFKLGQLDKPSNPSRPGGDFNFTDADYKAAWLKSVTTERQTAENRIELIVQWELALWDTFTYETYTPTP